ncbi:MAG: LacI family DNA-binding transcriptional regulator [Ignavibacteriales bacterium]|nr:LacI family DNA-binding transcriptional regulator [Ignavibacteriales bacterium]
MKEKAVTLNDIAEKLNLSTVTISKALRNHPDISLKTTKLIKTIAEEMGYTPNIMARNLSARKSNTIGLVVPKIAHFFFGSIIECVYDLAFQNNYEIILTVSQESVEREKKHLQTLLAMKVDGIIVSITQETTDFSIFDMIERRGVPLVFMDRIPEIANGYNTVRVDDRGGAFKAIEHAINLGYKNIAHFGGYHNINIGRERKAGFLEAMQKYNLEVNESWVTEGGFGENYGYDTFMKLYRDNNLPDLIFAVTYPVALGIYMAASEVGLHIPDDIDVICFGNAKVQNFLSPPLSCVDQSTELLSKHAMEMILENIEKREDYEPRQVVVDTNLVLRGTCIRFNKNR